MKKNQGTFIPFILSFILPGAGLVYLGKWQWGLMNFAAVLLIAFGWIMIAPDTSMDTMRVLGIGCSALSGGMAYTVAEQEHAKKKSS